MIKEDKELLFKDLCARLPYSVKCEIDDIDEPLELESIKFKGDYFIFGNGVYERYITEIKPYLRPMSSMTEEEKLYLELNYGFELHGNVLSNLHIIKSGGYYEREGEYVEPTEYRQYTHITIDTVSELIKWLNAHHFDYRRLIEKGLALEAPEGMYNIKEK